MNQSFTNTESSPSSDIASVNTSNDINSRADQSSTTRTSDSILYIWKFRKRYFVKQMIAKYFENVIKTIRYNLVECEIFLNVCFHEEGKTCCSQTSCAGINFSAKSTNCWIKFLWLKLLKAAILYQSDSDFYMSRLKLIALWVRSAPKLSSSGCDTGNLSVNISKQATRENHGKRVLKIPVSLLCHIFRWQQFFAQPKDEGNFLVIQLLSRRINLFEIFPHFVVQLKLSLEAN